MKKLVVLMLSLCIMLSACGGYEFEIKNPEGETVFETEDIKEGEAAIAPEETENPEIPETKGIGLVTYSESETPADFPKTEEGALLTEWKIPGSGFTIYLYDFMQGGFHGIGYPPAEGDVSLDSFVAFIAKNINEYSFSPEEIEFSCRQQKDMVVVDVNILGENAKTALDDERTCTEFLESISRTLIENHDCYDIGFTMGGGGRFATASYELEDDGWGRYIPQELFCKVSSEEFDDLRAICEYPAEFIEQKLENCYRGQDEYPFKTENVSLPKEAYLLLYAGVKADDFKNHSEIDDTEKVTVALEKLPLATTDPNYADTDPYFDVEPIEREINDSQFWPKEWVEKFLEYLFGNDVTVNHGTERYSDYKYHASVGVYTPPHRGGAAYVYPYIVSADETENGYEVEFFRLIEGMPGFFFNYTGELQEYEWGSDGNAVYENFWEDPRITEFAENPDETYIATLERNEEGRLIIISCKKK